MAHPPQVVAPLLAQAGYLLKARRPRDAVPVLREVTRWLPGNAAVLHDLGLACLESGQLGDAIAALRSCVAIDPSFSDAHLRLGIALEMSGEPEAALVAYDRAAEMPAIHAEASYRAAHLLDSLGHTALAAGMFRRAAASAGAQSAGQIAMARALLAENRDPEAEKALRRLLRMECDNAVALDLLGNILADAGRFEEARRCFERAIEKAPGLAGSYYDLVRCSRLEAEDVGRVSRMRAALASPDLEPAQKIRVHLALGKAADDLGDYQEAMRQFDAAESLRNARVRFDLARFERRVERLTASISHEVIAHTAATGSADATPILIVGLPRSGTTLLEQLISAHPSVRAGGELPFWNERGAAWERAATEQARAELLARSAADYRGTLLHFAGGVTRVTDKMPLNFQWVGLIHLALPRATIIHCRRNLLDTALSIHQTHFNPHLWFPTGGAALVGYIRAYERLCAHWRSVMPPERFIEIDYEELVQEPDPTIRRMVAACGLQWNEACLSPQSNTRIVKTASKWQARQPIYRDAIARWRRYEPWLGALSALHA
jgi:tetratricopeptide (TPR) repeat protein